MISSSSMTLRSLLGVAEHALIEDEQIYAQQWLCYPSGFAVVLFALQEIDQVNRGVEAHALAVRDDG